MEAKKSLRVTAKAFFVVTLVILFSFFAFFNSVRIKACEDCTGVQNVINENVIDLKSEEEFDFENGEVTPFSSSGGQEWMKNYYKIDNGLKTQPSFWVYNLLDVVKVGDIYYERKAGGGYGHVAVVTGIKYDNKYKKYYIELIENAEGYNVCYGMLDDYRCYHREASILRFNDITNSQIEKVVTYLKGSIGKTYRFFSFNCANLVADAFGSVGYNFKLAPIAKPKNIISHEKLVGITINGHECTEHSKYMIYESIDKTYHKRICYCGQVEEQAHITVSYGKSRRCKLCGHFFSYNDGPTPEIPFLFRMKNAYLWLNKLSGNVEQSTTAEDPYRKGDKNVYIC